MVVKIHQDILATDNQDARENLFPPPDCSCRIFGQAAIIRRSIRRPGDIPSIPIAISMFQRIAPSRLLKIEARRICIVKPSALGDVVQSLPLLPVLRERFPAARIAWVINRELTDVLSGHPHLDDVLPFDRRGRWNSWTRLWGELRRGRYDLVFDLQGLLRTGLMAAATRAPVRVGLETAREGAHLLANCTLPDSGKRVPAHLRYWRVAESIGMGDYRRQTFVKVSGTDRRWTRQQFQDLPGPVLAIHPGARWVTKRWPVEKFAVIAGKAMRRYGFSVVILGAAPERPIAEQLEGLLQRFAPARAVRNLAGRTTLKQLAGVLSTSQLLLTNDSGPMHLAAGLGTPVLGIFTCTNPERSGPPGDRHELVSTEVPCSASYKKRCPHRGKRHLACMDELSIARVAAAFDRLVEKNQILERAA